MSETHQMMHGTHSYTRVGVSLPLFGPECNVRVTCIILNQHAFAWDEIVSLPVTGSFVGEVSSSFNSLLTADYHFPPSSLCLSL